MLNDVLKGFKHGQTQQCWLSLEKLDFFPLWSSKCSLKISFGDFSTNLHTVPKTRLGKLCSPHSAVFPWFHQLPFMLHFHVAQSFFIDLLFHFSVMSSFCGLYLYHLSLKATIEFLVIHVIRFNGHTPLPKTLDAGARPASKKNWSSPTFGLFTWTCFL